MNIVSILVTLIILGIGLALLYRILQKILPLLGIDGDWISIIFGVIGLIILIAVLGALGFGPSWIVVR